MQRIGRYAIQKEIARGGMGVVYEAYDPERRAAVAIKLMLPGTGATDVARKRFMREARARASQASRRAERQRALPS